MSTSIKPAAPFIQPESFVFTPENAEKAKKWLSYYPPVRKRSAIVPLLDIAQRQAGGWLPKAAMQYVGQMLGLNLLQVYEIATFYTMFNLAPTGKHVIQICTTTPCWLRGSSDVLKACQAKLGIKPGHTSADGQFSMVEVECLGACVNAPVMQIGDDFYEDLTPAAAIKIIEQLASGKAATPGPQIDRQTSAPFGGATTLNETRPAENTADINHGAKNA